MYVSKYWSPSPVSIMVADDLMPIWYNDICNYHDDAQKRKNIFF